MMPLLYEGPDGTEELWVTYLDTDARYHLAIQAAHGNLTGEEVRAQYAVTTEAYKAWREAIDDPLEKD